MSPSKLFTPALATLALGLLVPACGSPSGDEEAQAAENAPAPVVQAPARPAPEPPAPEPVQPVPMPQVVLLVGGKPATQVEAMTLDTLAGDALDYLESCSGQEDKLGGAPSWAAAREAPVCVVVQLLPPADLDISGRTVRVEELLVPLGLPQMDGRIYARTGQSTPGPFLGGDDLLYARLRDTAAGALGTTSLPTLPPDALPPIEDEQPVEPEPMTEPAPEDEPLPEDDPAPQDEPDPADEPTPEEPKSGLGA